jgi:hypothetical protein
MKSGADMTGLLLAAGVVIGLSWVAWEIWDRYQDWKIKRINEEALWAWQEEVAAWELAQLSSQEREERFFAEWTEKNSRGIGRYLDAE